MRPLALLLVLLTPLLLAAESERTRAPEIRRFHLKLHAPEQGEQRRGAHQRPMAAPSEARRSEAPSRMSRAAS